MVGIAYEFVKKGGVKRRRRDRNIFFWAASTRNTTLAAPRGKMRNIERRKGAKIDG